MDILKEDKDKNNDPNYDDFMNFLLKKEKNNNCKYFKIEIKDPDHILQSD